MGYDVQVMDLAFAGSREDAVTVTGSKTENEFNTGGGLGDGKMSPFSSHCMFNRGRY